MFEELRERPSSELHVWHSGDHAKGKHAVVYICNYIREHLLDNPSLVHCSELVAMNPSYLSRLFRKETGVSFVEFITQCRLAESEKMLIYTNMHIAEIASTIGITDRHFLRIFHKYWGITPSQYRVCAFKGNPSRM
ncbi:helix-turn-helix transcriptional regulator [Paenibacillus sp. FSL H8-0034]|uniref:helix-turn-helix transcriptional regulator n=1 Tax=Paenibacillus sp. FSL H8-0034 TaxID=2954671 RepID=UPI0030FA6A43